MDSPDQSEENAPAKIGRRSFLKVFGAAIAGLGLAATGTGCENPPTKHEAAVNSQNLQNRGGADARATATADQAKKEGEQVQKALGTDKVPQALQ